MRRLICAAGVLTVVYATSLAAQPRPHFTSVFSQEEFAQRRARVMTEIGSNAIALLKGNEGFPSYVEIPPGQQLLLPLRSGSAGRGPAPGRPHA